MRAVLDSCLQRGSRIKDRYSATQFPLLVEFKRCAFGLRVFFLFFLNEIQPHASVAFDFQAKNAKEKVLRNFLTAATGYWINTQLHSVFLGHLGVVYLTTCWTLFASFISSVTPKNEDTEKTYPNLTKSEAFYYFKLKP